MILKSPLSRALIYAGLALPALATATPWEFSEAMAVTPAGPGVFHHLESAGRRNLATSDDSVAVVWEDNRDGSPRVYAARKGMAEEGFSAALRLSGEGESFEPAIAPLGGGRFAAAWEEDGRVRLRIFSEKGPGPVFELEGEHAVQPSLTVRNGALYLVAAEREGRFTRIRLHRFEVDSEGALKQTAACPVDAEPPKDSQLYPALAIQRDRLVVAWEDRRPGHTIILAADSPADEPCEFTPSRRISERPKGGGDLPYGSGHGVARVALAVYGEDRVLAAWADKRNFREGYDIYAVHWQPAKGFGSNEPVQDAFGGVARQWHAAAAGTGDGQLVVAWDDERDGDANVMLSWREDGVWSDDQPLPPASGEGEQSHPAITFDAHGNLHAAWVHRDAAGGPTRLLYAMGRAAP